MFNKEPKDNNYNEAETIIGPSIKVKGNFHGEGNMVIEGIVEGSIKTNNNLYVGDKAIITANIEAKEAKIGGKVDGNIKVQGYLEITSTAIITGDVEASMVSIEKGGIVNGCCTMQAGNNATHHSEKKHE